MVLSDMRPKMVSVLLPDLRPGGAERVAINLCNHFVRQSIGVDIVLLRKEGELLDAVDPAVRVVGLDSRRVRNCVRPLAAYLRERKPHVMMANMWPLPVAALLARALARTHSRIVGVEHTTWSRSELFANSMTRAQIKFSMRWVYPHLDGLVAVSNGAAEDLGRVSGLRRDAIRTIYNPIAGVSSQVHDMTTSPPPAPWAEGNHDKVLAVGTLKAIKDYATLLRAFAKLRMKRDARLLILGEGEQREALESLVAALGLGDTVFMPGFAADTRTYYGAADLFVLSSTGEGFGNVIVEALEQGTPVVSTDCPSGPREILEDGKYGTLVPVGDVDAMALAMEDALSSKHDHEALKRRAQDFSVDKAADAYLDLLLPGWRRPDDQ